jgi:GxxExxY protein
MSLENQISYEVIGAAIEVHRHLGPGLLESAYQQCLAREMTLRSIPFLRKEPLRLQYKGICIDKSYEMDFIIKDLVVVEIKSVDILIPIHEAQVLTYLRLSGCRLGLLINFNVPILKDGGIKRIVLGL